MLEKRNFAREDVICVDLTIFHIFLHRQEFSLFFAWSIERHSKKRFELILFELKFVGTIDIRKRDIFSNFTGTIRFGEKIHILQRSVFTNKCMCFLLPCRSIIPRGGDIVLMSKWLQKPILRGCFSTKHRGSWWFYRLVFELCPFFLPNEMVKTKTDGFIPHIVYHWFGESSQLLQIHGSCVVRFIFSREIRWEVSKFGEFICPSEEVRKVSFSPNGYFLNKKKALTQTLQHLHYPNCRTWNQSVAHSPRIVSVILNKIYSYDSLAGVLCSQVYFCCFVENQYIIRYPAVTGA